MQFSTGSFPDWRWLEFEPRLFDSYSSHDLAERVDLAGKGKIAVAAVELQESSLLLASGVQRPAEQYGVFTWPFWLWVKPPLHLLIGQVRSPAELALLPNHMVALQGPVLRPPATPISMMPTARRWRVPERPRPHLSAGGKQQSLTQPLRATGSGSRNCDLTRVCRAPDTAGVGFAGFMQGPHQAH